uniref:Uncharacterized protein n=1 Tax=Chromera velia CCMP2878 TaxID=1169474 RepID=A0A0G4FCD7_9ALVE|eukprot:Cvel_16174.t1-p1 / transcript=Cvel_16174.t1 / gene=Cvel_16174 / organism=Chromera_velia_CCMP2878 / gene_product=hypothetical protein / transcript_product=hypothetical protein / location=Cvel_scaffold1233:39870-41240(+) / protein_length=457 / sequence_SO=supercontig / SO=protein_coding / is_pseudo=false
MLDFSSCFPQSKKRKRRLQEETAETSGLSLSERRGVPSPRGRPAAFFGRGWSLTAGTSTRLPRDVWGVSTGRVEVKGVARVEETGRVEVKGVARVEEMGRVEVKGVARVEEMGGTSEFSQESFLPSTAALSRALRREALQLYLPLLAVLNERDVSSGDLFEGFNHLFGGRRQKQKRIHQVAEALSPHLPSLSAIFRKTLGKERLRSGKTINREIGAFLRRFPTQEAHTPSPSLFQQASCDTDREFSSSCESAPVALTTSESDASPVEEEKETSEPQQQEDQQERVETGFKHLFSGRRQYQKGKGKHTEIESSNLRAPRGVWELPKENMGSLMSLLGDRSLTLFFLVEACVRRKVLTGRDIGEGLRTLFSQNALAENRKQAEMKEDACARRLHPHLGTLSVILKETVGVERLIDGETVHEATEDFLSQKDQTPPNPSGKPMFKSKKRRLWIQRIEARV